MENRVDVTHRPAVFASILAATVVILISLTLMAGLPPADRAVGFMVGVVVLLIVLSAIGFAGWHLMVRPLPEGLKQIPAQPLLTTRSRHVVALLLTLGTLCVGLAGVWDEIWHSKYGIPFGEDFFWRPHLLLYFSFGVLIGTGLWSWWVILTRGKGTLQQRFRANPMMGISFLIGAFTVFALGADPVWHRLYGADLAPWSLPHLLILMLILLMGLLTIAYHKSLMSQREWQFKPNLTGRDVLIGFALVGVMLTYTLIFTIQWYAASAGSRQMAQLMSYPDWLIAVFATFLATFFGTTILHATRQIGSSTMLGVLTLGTRFILDNGFTGVRDGTLGLWLILPLMIALDVWYAVSIYRTQKPPTFWTTALAVALVYGVVGVPIIALRFAYPPISLGVVPGMLIASAITAAAGVWLGQILGDMNRYGHEVVQEETAAKAGLTTKWMYISFAAFVVVFVLTATPPA